MANMESNDFFLSFRQRFCTIIPCGPHDVALNEPKRLNLDKLAKATNRSLKLLEPWCKDDDSRAIGHKHISDKARTYLGAIEDSVNAAQFGYSVAKDAICLLKTVDAGEKGECDKYARILLEHAAEAHQCASESHQKFRHVRQELIQLISNARAEGGGQAAEAALNELEKKGIPAFEKVAKCVEQYIKWWSWIELSTSSNEANVKQLTIKYTKIRSDRAVKQWEEIQGTFLQYTNAITTVQDTHPNLFPNVANAQHLVPEKDDPEKQDLKMHIDTIMTTRRNHRQQKPWVSRAFSAVSSFAGSLICL